MKISQKFRDPLLENSVYRLLRSIGEVFEVGVYWNPRLQTTIGLANLTNNIITLNPKLKRSFPQETDRTLRHELAHLLVQHRYPHKKKVKAHGKKWKQACVDLGIPNENRCHNLPIPQRKVARRFVYECPACRTRLERVVPIKKRRKLACLKCCKKDNGGKYHKHFRFVPVSSTSVAIAA